MNALAKSCAAALVLFAAGASGCDESALPTDAGTSALPPLKTSSSAATAPLPPMPKADPIPPTPNPLPELKVPADNALTPEKVALGKQLFFDKRLSKDGSTACQTCHLPEKGWTDGNVLSQKVGGAMNTRHSPTLLNVGYNDAWYWDGRSPTLEKTAEAAWKGQMGADPAVVAATIAKIAGYAVQFKTIFDGEATPDAIAKSLASFIRTLRSGDAPWDAYEKGDKKAVSTDAVKGFDLFRNKAGCAACHAPPLYTDNGFHDVGIGSDKPEPDLGRGKITKDKKDEGLFKTPTLRSVGLHPPYFHDGSKATLESAIDLLLAGGIKNANLDKRVKPVKLSAAERKQLTAFVKALEPATPPFVAPTLPQ